jgi:hypothetical protein
VFHTYSACGVHLIFMDLLCPSYMHTKGTNSVAPHYVACSVLVPFPESWVQVSSSVSYSHFTCDCLFSDYSNRTVVKARFNICYVSI